MMYNEHHMDQESIDTYTGIRYQPNNTNIYWYSWKYTDTNIQYQLTPCDVRLVFAAVLMNKWAAGLLTQQSVTEPRQSDTKSMVTLDIPP